MSGASITALPGVEIVPPERVFWRLWRRDGSSFFADQTEYDRLRSLGVRKFVAAERAKVHRCAACGHEGPWTDDWMWFGSYQDLDDEKPIQKFCSEPCRKQRSSIAKATGQAGQ